MLDEHGRPLEQHDIYYRLILLSAQWAREAVDEIVRLREDLREALTKLEDHRSRGMR